MSIDMRTNQNERRSVVSAIVDDLPDCMKITQDYERKKKENKGKVRRRMKKWNFAPEMLEGVGRAKKKGLQ